MSERWPGGIINKTANVPQTTQPYCGGVWTLDQAAYWKAQGQWPYGPYDSNFSNVSLLLNGDGTNGAQNNTFLDSSTNNFTITRNGNTTQGSFSPYGSLWSNFFDGTGDYLSLTGATAFGTSNYTVEYWIFPTSTELLQGVFVTSLSAVTGNLRTGIYNGKVYVDIYDGTGSIDAGSTVPLNTWSHIAITKSGSSYTSYLNGAVNTTWTDSTTITGTTWTIGRLQSDGYDYQGYVSNLRVVVGSVVYTGAFTPSTTPLTAVTNTKLLTCQSNRFIDNSTSAFALTRTGNTSVQRFSPFNPTAPYSTSVIGGSGYFDGSGDYLALPSSSNLAFGTGDFSVEAWVYPTSMAANANVISNATSDDTQFGFLWLSTGALRLAGWNTAFLASSAGAITANQWQHVICCRSGTTASLYVNGIRVATATVTNNFSSTNAMNIGRNPTPFDYLVGNMTDLRILKGSSAYLASSSTVTIPTAPESTITNTQLLLSYTNAGIPDLAMQNNLETVGNAQVSTSVKKYGTGSLSFNGTNSQLKSPNTFIFSGNFTVEGWFYASSSSTNFPSPICATTANQFQLQFNSTVTTYYLNFAGSTVINAQASGITTNTWNHIAIVRSGSTITVYFNGVAANTASSSSTVSQVLFIGSDSSSSNWWNGYIDDLRITQGLARYTANFTPPTAALPTY